MSFPAGDSFDDREVEFEVKEQSQAHRYAGRARHEQLGDQMKGVQQAVPEDLPQKMKVGAAWRHLIEARVLQVSDEDKISITDLARERVEQMGIVFIDEIDWLASGSRRSVPPTFPAKASELNASPPSWKAAVSATANTALSACGTRIISCSSRRARSIYQAFRPLFLQIAGPFPAPCGTGGSRKGRILPRPDRASARSAASDSMRPCLNRGGGAYHGILDDGLREIAAFMRKT